MRARPATPTAARRRLRLVFGVGFCLLAVPTVALLVQAFEQLALDAFRRQQLEAERFVAAVDAGLTARLRDADARAFEEFAFLARAADDGEPRRSPLAAFPPPADVPGLLGYFQVDADGALTTPLLPPEDVDASRYGIAEDELTARRERAARLRDALAENRIVRRAPPPAAAAPRVDSERRERAAIAAADEDAAGGTPDGQRVFDRLAASSSVRNERRNEAPQAAAFALESAIVDAVGADDARKLAAPSRQAAEAEAPPGSPAKAQERADLRIDVFTSELEPFTFSLLDTGHFVLFRDAWRDGRRFVQGALIEQAPFLEGLVVMPFAASVLAEHTELAVGYAGRALRGARPAGDDVLLRARLSPPFADLELALTAVALPPAPGRTLLIWLAAVLAIVLPSAFALAYRFAWRQTALVRQQQDFVSAVSHELKTPLTSIRMYGEMLMAGWADEAKRRTYYEYIYNESERLSRLIENVLQLARMTRQGLELETQAHEVAELMDLVESKVANRIEHAGFELDAACETELGATRLDVDADSFVQIAINLIDNAVKFSADADKRVVDVRMRRGADGRVEFAVRDYGPGVPRRTMRRLFELFYRPDNELTRATAGTGIGLALVKQLAEAMRGKVDLKNREPGAEFVVSFPAVAATAE